MSDAPENRIYLDEMASILGRSSKTVRNWYRESVTAYVTADKIVDVLPQNPDQSWPKSDDYVPAGTLPRDLHPAKEGSLVNPGQQGRKKLYWTPEQVDGMKEFSQVKGSRQGWGGNTQQAAA